MHEPLPRVSLKSVFSNRLKIEKILVKYTSSGRFVESLTRATDLIYTHYKGCVDYAALLTSVLKLSDAQVAPRDVAWAIAGNVSVLKHRPVMPGRWPTDPVWLVWQVLDVLPVHNRRQERRVLLRVRCLAGEGCPGVITVSWSEKAARFYATHKHGFGLVTDGNVRYVNPRQLVGCRFYGKIALGVKLKLPKIRATATQQKQNLALLAARCRVKFKCPNGWTHPCHTCAVGYSRCPVGTHSEDWARETCQTCLTRTTVDPAWDRATCLTCLMGRKPHQ